MLPIGTEVRVHLNLNAKRSGKPHWVICVNRRVVDYANDIVLSGVTFKVSEARRIAVNRQRAREVHAWAFGTIAAAMPAGEHVAVTYNPYRAPLFHRADNGAAVSQCAAVHFTSDGVALAVIR